MSENKAHSTLGASSSHRWWHCPGSIQLSVGMPNESSFFAMEGSCAHAVGEAALNQGQDADAFIGRVIKEFPEIEVDEEMAEAVQLYLDTVRDDMRAHEDAELSVETRFDLTHIHAGMFGTNDACVYLPSKAKLIVYDYKHGRGMPVEVENNPQMLYYATGALTGKHNRPIAEIEVVIVQPRCSHPGGAVRRWSLTPLDLMDWINELQDAAKRTEEKSPTLVAGEWCKFCPAAGACPELQSHVLKAARADFTEEGEIVVSEPRTYSSESIARALEQADIIENWIRSVRAFAHLEAEAGRVPPGWKLVQKRANRKWKSEERLIETMIDYGFTRASITNPGKLMSPAQLEAFLKPKGIKKEEISDLYESVSSGSTLAPADDKREAVKAEASTEFM